MDELLEAIRSWLDVKDHPEKLWFPDNHLERTSKLVEDELSKIIKAEVEAALKGIKHE